MRRTALIKYYNPHLAGGEKQITLLVGPYRGYHFIRRNPQTREHHILINWVVLNLAELL